MVTFYTFVGYQIFLCYTNELQSLLARLRIYRLCHLQRGKTFLIRSFKYDTKLHLMVSLKFWQSSNVKCLFIAITPRPTPTQKGSTDIISGSQIYLFKIYSYSMGPCAKITLKTQQKCLYERTMNVNT